MRNLRLSFAYQNPLKARFTAEFFSRLPSTPGVYFMLSTEGEILYIGKAKSLQARLSQYRNAKPGSVGENIVELLEHVAEIRWELCETEEKALFREGELLRAIRPPYNIAGTEEESYLFIGIRELSTKSVLGQKRLEFRLTRRNVEEGYEIFGCYKHRTKVKAGYSAILRLLYAATANQSRFSIPAKMCRASPAWICQTAIRAEWLEPLRAFLRGRDLGILRLITQAMLENENLPAFAIPALQEDLQTVQEFFAIGPQRTLDLKTQYGLRTRVVTHRQMDKLIQLGLESSSSWSSKSMTRS